MKLLPIFATAAAVAIIGAAGFAQTPATTTPGTAATKPAATTPAAKPTGAEKAAISKACSAQADAKNLHGKERKNFRAECMRSGGKPS
jgi:hypothetical protein